MGINMRIESWRSACSEGVLALLAQAPDAVIVYDNRDRVLFANERAEALYGRPAPDLVGRDVGTVLPRRTRGSPARKPAEPVTIRTDSLGLRRCLVSYAVLAGPAGDVTVATLRDVTAESEELARLRLLSLAADETGTSVVVTDARGRIVFASAGFEALTGHRPDWSLGRTPGSFLQGELSDRETIRRIGLRLRDGLPVEEEIVNYTRNGVPYLIELLIVPVRDGSGAVSHFVSVQANVTAARDAERHRMAMLRAISDATAIAQWSEAGVMLDCNDFLSSQGPRRPRLRDLLTEDEQDAVMAGRIVRRDVAWPRAEGDTTWLEAAFSCTRDISGRIDRFVMCGSDATARRAGMRAGSDAMQAMMHDIQGLTKTIRRVSRLTNILSVNAAIEAGRAGEAGRGFGVIGQEIQSLSGEVHETLERIDALLRDGRDTVDRLQGTIAPEER